jgi:hypothetical protein
VDQKLTVDPKVAAALKDPGPMQTTVTPSYRPPAGSPGGKELGSTKMQPVTTVVVSQSPAAKPQEIEMRAPGNQSVTAAGGSPVGMPSMTLPPTATPAKPAASPSAQAASEGDNAFSRAVPSQPTAQAGPAYNAFSPGATETPNMPMNGYPTQSGPGMLPPPPGYAAAPRTISPPMPQGAPAGTMQQANVDPGVTQGAYPIQTVSARVPMSENNSVTGAAEPRLPARGSFTTQQSMSLLHDSLYPSQREWAADQLSMLDWRTNESAMQALLRAAKEDPAATVRASCVRGLVRMNVNTMPVVMMLQGMNDSDPRVQTEVDRALAKLAPGQRATPSSVQPAGAMMPPGSN